mgnify:CR=1 FL=1|jgi:ParB family chromosome partitioning protein
MAIDLTGLDDFNHSDFIIKEKTSEATAGVLLAPIEKFHEDPNNPRKIFKEEAIQELVSSIKSINPNTGKPRGILQPLSVSDHPTIKGELLINGGSRRYRAAKIAGLKELPYFIDNNADSADKVVDNLIREGFEVLEMAEYIKNRHDEGMKAGEIAKSIGKKPAFVSDYLAFSLMSESIIRLLDKGYTSSIQVLATLHRASKNHPEEVELFCRKITSQITYSKVIAFVDSLKEDKKPNQVIEGIDTQQSEINEEVKESEESLEAAADHILEKDKTPSLSKPILIVEYEGDQAELLIKKKSKSGFGWIKREFDSEEKEVILDSLKIVNIVGK